MFPPQSSAVGPLLVIQSMRRSGCVASKYDLGANRHLCVYRADIFNVYMYNHRIIHNDTNMILWYTNPQTLKIQHSSRTFDIGTLNFSECWRIGAVTLRSLRIRSTEKKHFWIPNMNHLWIQLLIPVWLRPLHQTWSFSMSHISLSTLSPHHIP